MGPTACRLQYNLLDGAAPAAIDPTLHDNRTAEWSVAPLPTYTATAEPTAALAQNTIICYYRFVDAMHGHTRCFDMKSHWGPVFYSIMTLNFKCNAILQLCGISLLFDAIARIESARFCCWSKWATAPHTRAASRTFERISVTSQAHHYTSTTDTQRSLSAEEAYQPRLANRTLENGGGRMDRPPRYATQ